MPDPPKIAKISASINGGEYSPESLRFDIEVNTVPTLKVGALPQTKDTVRSPVSAETIERIKRLQEARLAGRTEPDLTVTADDGNGGSMTFSGFVSAPILSFSRVNTFDQFSGVGVDALLDALDLSIYTAGHGSERTETGGEQKTLKPVPAAKDGDVIGTIRAITQVLIDNYPQALARETMPLSRDIVAIKHGLNESAPKKLWFDVLNQSDVQFDTWKAAFKYAEISQLLSENIKNILISKTPGFWNVMRHLMATFQMHYIPSFSGVGRFARADTKVADTDTELEVSISGLSLSDGNPRIMQPGGVVMIAQASATDRKETSPDPDKPRISAFYPNPLLPGFIQEEVPPFWLVRAGGVPVFGIEVSERSTGAPKKDGKKLDLDQYRKDLTGVYKDRKELNLVSEGVLTELCEIIFKEIQLAHSTATLTLPLDFKANDKLGKRANISILGPDGKPSGKITAFVSGLSHTVDLRQGKELNSMTEVRCTHVKFG